MQVAAPQLAAQLQRGLRSLYTLHGDDPLLVQDADLRELLAPAGARA